MKRSLKLLALAMFSMVFAVACGNDNEEPKDTPAPVDTPVQAVVEDTTPVVDTPVVDEPTPAKTTNTKKPSKTSKDKTPQKVDASNATSTAGNGTGTFGKTNTNNKKDNKVNAAGATSTTGNSTGTFGRN